MLHDLQKVPTSGHAEVAFLMQNRHHQGAAEPVMLGPAFQTWRSLERKEQENQEENQEEIQKKIERKSKENQKKIKRKSKENIKKIKRKSKENHKKIKRKSKENQKKNQKKKDEPSAKSFEKKKNCMTNLGICQTQTFLHLIHAEQQPRPARWAAESPQQPGQPAAQQPSLRPRAAGPRQPPRPAGRRRGKPEPVSKGKSPPPHIENEICDAVFEYTSRLVMLEGQETQLWPRLQAICHAVSHFQLPPVMLKMQSFPTPTSTTVRIFSLLA